MSTPWIGLWEPKFMRQLGMPYSRSYYDAFRKGCAHLDSRFHQFTPRLRAFV